MEGLPTGSSAELIVPGTGERTAVDRVRSPAHITRRDDVAWRSMTRFHLDGVTYEIDLTAAERAVLRDRLAPYITVARRISGPSPRTTTADGQTTAREVRQWARAHGYPVAVKGRLPRRAREAYLRARDADPPCPIPPAATPCLPLRPPHVPGERAHDDRRTGKRIPLDPPRSALCGAGDGEGERRDPRS